MSARPVAVAAGTSSIEACSGGNMRSIRGGFGWARGLLLALILVGAPDLRAQPADGAGRIQFREASEEWGLAFRHHHGGTGHRYMVETMVGGVVLLDFDNDGDLDVLYVDGGPTPDYEGESPRPELFRNDGEGHFVPFTDRSGLSFDAYGCGGAAADIDNDGDLDLYITAFGQNALFLNNGDGTWKLAGPEHGLDERLWSASAAFADSDHDGDLDLYLANYVDFAWDNHRYCGEQARDLRGYCHPGVYRGLPDRFYRNDGAGRFTDATAASGLAGKAEAGLGVIFSDLDNDGWSDLYVANDADPNFLFRNRGDGTFEDISLLSGTAYNRDGRPEAGMGVDTGDVDGNGFLDIVVTNFEFETNGLYQNNGGGLFVDGRYSAGIAETSIQKLAFGVTFADFDQDKDLDLFVANGHILDNASEFNEISSYEQANQVYENLGDGRFHELAETGVDIVRASRGLATGDLDNDGDQDVVILNSDDWSEVYENVSVGGAWLLVDLEGDGSNHFGVGSRLIVETATDRLQREARTASSYLSQGALSAHFGLHEAATVDSLEVRWPGGGRQRFKRLPTNHRIRVSEGS